VRCSDGASLAAPVPVGINSALLCLVAPLDEYIKTDKRLRASMCEAAARASGGRIRLPQSPPRGLQACIIIIFCCVFGKMISIFFSFEKSSGLSERWMDGWMDGSIYIQCAPDMSSAVCHGCTAAAAAAASMLAMRSDPSNPRGELSIGNRCGHSFL
jgi:hypothetical protein